MSNTIVVGMLHQIEGRVDLNVVNCTILHCLFVHFSLPQSHVQAVGQSLSLVNLAVDWYCHGSIAAKKALPERFCSFVT